MLHLTDPAQKTEEDGALRRWPCVMQRGMIIQVGDDERPKRISVNLNYYTGEQDMMVNIEEEGEDAEESMNEGLEVLI